MSRQTELNVPPEGVLLDGPLRITMHFVALRHVVYRPWLEDDENCPALNDIGFLAYPDKCWDVLRMLHQKLVAL